MRINEEHCPKKAIKTRFGSFKWRVLCFGLTNAPDAFSRLILSVLQNLNGECVVLFLEDIRFYSKCIEDHRIHLSKLLDLLQEYKLYSKVSNRSWRSRFSRIHFQQIRHSYTKKALRCSTGIGGTTNVKDMQRCLGLAKFYRRFVKGYADIVRLAADLVRGKQFHWGR